MLPPSHADRSAGTGCRGRPAATPAAARSASEGRAAPGGLRPLRRGLAAAGLSAGQRPVDCRPAVIGVARGKPCKLLHLLRCPERKKARRARASTFVLCLGQGGRSVIGGGGTSGPCRKMSSHPWRGRTDLLPPLRHPGGAIAAALTAWDHASPGAGCGQAHSLPDRERHCPPAAARCFLSVAMRLRAPPPPRLPAARQIRERA